MAVTINASTSSGLVQTADTSGTVEIQSNGSTKLTVSSTGAYGQLVSATAQTASSTAVDFTGIPSWVKRITVMFSGVSTSGTSIKLVQLGDSGGFETTGYLGSASRISSTSPATSTYTAGMGIESALSTNLINGQIVISLLNASTNTWAMFSVMSASDSAQTYYSASSKALSDTLTQVRITTVNGTDTFDAGTINILYEG